MKRFLGYNILLIDSDLPYLKMLSESLKSEGSNCVPVTSLRAAKTFVEKYDYDLILCHPFLTDGYIHQFIDWCKDHLEVMPLFGVLGDAQGLESKILKKYAIAAVVEKAAPLETLAQLQKLLFNRDDFKTRLSEMNEEKGLFYEFQFGQKKVYAKPMEMTGDSLFVTFPEAVEDKSHGILRLAAFDPKDTTTFLLMGHIYNLPQGGQEFRIHENYIKVWAKVLVEFEKRQSQIINFLQKASGY